MEAMGLNSYLSLSNKLLEPNDIWGNFPDHTSDDVESEEAEGGYLIELWVFQTLLIC